MTLVNDNTMVQPVDSIVLSMTENSNTIVLSMTTTIVLSMTKTPL